ncbi:MAG: DNA polymerase III subunit gamma/tau [Chloracidobacterium sp.]|nr:DNA polymerase III subunit gamma/tau [Chloracidobacterium sp.]
MSYQVIARKWRPQTFDEVTGQEVITQTLRNAIEHDRLHHAYLFSGARGVGKTTTARILAKALNCHRSDKPTLTPCGSNEKEVCPSCQEIAEGRSMDVLEIDAASHTGIDDVRETIINSIDFNPARDRYRVFIIDEVHQLSKPAFNALLKTVEEPPPNVVFVMATTELHKVPETITSRCQEFQFRTIPLQKIFDRLKLIADAEKIDIDDDALRELARSGEGSMRDAQSNFDQVISFSGEKIRAVDVTGALGFAGAEVLAKAVTAIAERQARSLLAVVDDLIVRGHDLRNFCRDLLGLFRDLLVFKIAGSESQLFETAVFAGEQMTQMVSGFAEADLLRFFNSLAATEASLRDAAHPRYVLEIGLVKLIEMRKVADIEDLIARMNALIGGESTSVAASASATATEEKKTLISESSPAPPEEFTETEPATVVFEAISEPFDVSEPVQPRRAAWLPPPTAEMLAHIDDKRLDGGYELQLEWSGDDLLPITNVSAIVRDWLGLAAVEDRPPVVAASSGRAVAPAYEPRPSFQEPIDLPILSAEPSDEELLEYAKAHPAVREVIRVFRAEIIEVKRV